MKSEKEVAAVRTFPFFEQKERIRLTEYHFRRRCGAEEGEVWEGNLYGDAVGVESS